MKSHLSAGSFAIAGLLSVRVSLDSEGRSIIEARRKGNNMNDSQFAQYYDHNMMDGHDGGWGFLMMFVFIILGALLVFFIVKSSHHHYSHSQKNSPNALDVAKSRYAKGDITKAEYDVLKKDLKD